jgi:hypothetical protein
MLPPKLERVAGTPRVKRIKARGEPGKRGPYQCKRCFQFGHIEKGCFEPPTELGAELPPSFAAKSKGVEVLAVAFSPLHLPYIMI